VHHEHSLISAFVKRSERERYREILANPRLRHKFTHLPSGSPGAPTSRDIAEIGKSKTLTTHSTTLRAGYGHEGTRRGILEEIPWGSIYAANIFGVPLLPSRCAASARNDRG
jgi:hypothetical protein